MPSGLLLEEDIIHVHEDYDRWAALCVGYNDEKMLVIELTFDQIGNDYDTKSVEWDKRLIIDSKGIDILMNRLHTTLLKLPQAISKKFGEEGEWASVSDVRDTYNEIRDYLDNLRIHYRYEKEYLK